MRVDLDGDFVDDARDKCPDIVEDWDRFEDADGCPDVDDDSDGVGDLTDDCPDRPAPLTTHGCPPSCVIVSSSIDCWNSETLFFDRDGALSEDARTRIGQLRGELAQFPEIEGVVITSWRNTREPPDVAAARGKDVIDALARAGIAIPAEMGEPVVDDNPKRLPRAVIRVGRQRFTAEPAKFRTIECTPIGGIYRPARPKTC